LTYYFTLQILSSCFLHREIREKGGAYGGGCSLSSDGTFTLTSYRDPHLARTLSTFQEGFNWMFSPSSFSDRDIREAKLSLFASIDRPVPPGSRGLSEFSSGITYEQRERRRAQLLSVRKQDVLDAFSEHVVSKTSDCVSIAALGSDQLVLDDAWTRKKI
jgi:Zn-dependent M16 (insulinase) family peptidase